MDIGFALDRHIDPYKGVVRQPYPQRQVVEKERPRQPYDDLLSPPERSVTYEVIGDRLPPQPERDLLWFLSTFPAPPEGATGPAIDYSYAGYLGRMLATIFEPIGFNWQISIALVPGLAAREVAVSALGTVYALSATDDTAAQVLAPIIAGQWSLATALSLLAWYVIAPQCLSTLVVVKRETGGWRAPILMATYLFALAYLAAFVTYRAALALGA